MFNLGCFSGFFFFFFFLWRMFQWLVLKKQSKQKKKESKDSASVMEKYWGLSQSDCRNRYLKLKKSKGQEDPLWSQAESEKALKPQKIKWNKILSKWYSCWIRKYHKKLCPQDLLHYFFPCSWAMFLSLWIFFLPIWKFERSTIFTFLKSHGEV